MSREHGRFKKGFCGNPRGRPPEEKLTVPTLDELRKRFLRKLYAKRTLQTKDGKKKRVCPREVIEDRLIALGMSGDRQAVLKVLAIEEEMVAAKTDERDSLLVEIVEFERSLRENPESISEERLAALRTARRALEEGDKLD
jgi:uncharacterized protein DUF5681